MFEVNLEEHIQGLTNLKGTKSWVGAAMGLKVKHLQCGAGGVGGGGWEGGEGGEGGTGRQMSKAKSFLVVCILLSSIWVLRFGKKS